MPKSTRNKPADAPAGEEELLWKRQLEHGRFVLPAADSAVKPAARIAVTPDASGSEAQDSWRRQLEHGRLSAMAMSSQNPVFAGPGAAGAGAAKALAKGVPSPEEMKSLIKDGETLLKWQDRKQWPLKIVQLPWVGWLLAPIGLGGVACMKAGHDALQAGAARRLDGASKKYDLDKIPNPYIKLIVYIVRHWQKLQLGEWLTVIGGILLWFLVLFIIIALPYAIYKMQPWPVQKIIEAFT